MKVEFGVIEETAILGFKGGEGVTHARMFADGRNRIMRGRLEPGCSIGLHTHEGSSEIVYVLSGTGKALYGGGEERLAPGDCHYCPEATAICGTSFPLRFAISACFWCSFTNTDVLVFFGGILFRLPSIIL